MHQLGHAQVGNGSEILHSPETAGGPLGLLKQAIHGLDVGIAAAVEHAAHHAGHAFLEGVGQTCERLQAAAARPGYPAQQVLLRLGGAVGGHGAALDLAQGLLQAPGPRAFQIGAL